MVLNGVFYSWSAYLIYLTKSKTENTSTARTEFLLFLRLALIMGLTWVTGIVALIVDHTGNGSSFQRVLVFWGTKSCGRCKHEYTECNMFVNQLKSVPQTQHLTITNINWLTLFKEANAVYSESHTKQKKIFL
jgi:hypothetical protein